MVHINHQMFRSRAGSWMDADRRHAHSSNDGNVSCKASKFSRLGRRYKEATVVRVRRPGQSVRCWWAWGGEMFCNVTRNAQQTHAAAIARGSRIRVATRGHQEVFLYSNMTGRVLSKPVQSTILLVSSLKRKMTCPYAHFCHWGPCIGNWPVCYLVMMYSVAKCLSTSNLASYCSRISNYFGLGMDRLTFVNQGIVYWTEQLI